MLTVNLMHYSNLAMIAKVSFRRSKLGLYSSVFLCSEYSFQNPSFGLCSPVSVD